VKDGVDSASSSAFCILCEFPPLTSNSGESISDHMYRMFLITMFAPPTLASRIDIHRCTKMALIHDMAEALVGDITPVDGVAKTEKNRRESTTMDYFVNSLLGRVNGGMTSNEIKAI
jgi:putative hydrolase of HD superfamily